MISKKIRNDKLKEIRTGKKEQERDTLSHLCLVSVAILRRTDIIWVWKVSANLKHGDNKESVADDDRSSDELALFNIINAFFLDASERATRGQTVQCVPDMPKGYERADAY